MQAPFTGYYSRDGKADNCEPAETPIFLYYSSDSNQAQSATLACPKAPSTSTGIFNFRISWNVLFEILHSAFSGDWILFYPVSLLCHDARRQFESEPRRQPRPKPNFAQSWPTNPILQLHGQNSLRRTHHARQTAGNRLESPYLVNGRLSAAAAGGRQIFKQAKCLDCHSGQFFTDMKKYDVGTGRGQGEEFDTPTLAEIWRTAPYLQDGRAATIEEALTTCNSDDRHGVTSNLSQQQIRTWRNTC